jgi:hypothetical protein
MEITAVLEAHREGLERHAGLLEAQRAALRAGDFQQAAGFATDASQLIQDLERASRDLALVTPAVAAARGTKASSVRGLLSRLAADSERAQALVRQFTEVADARRGRLVVEIRGTQGEVTGPAGRPFRPMAPLPSFLDRSG